jgi:hypothetical protein
MSVKKKKKNRITNLGGEMIGIINLVTKKFCGF